MLKAYVGACLCLLLPLAAAAGLHSGIQYGGQGSTCRDFKVYILDLDGFLEPLGHAACVPEDHVVVDTRNGIVYTQEGAHEPGSEGYQEDVDTHHSFGTHAGPWHLAEAIKGSACETSDINAAGAVLVYDYCLYIRWLGMVHNAKDPMKLRATPGDLLLEAYNAMQRTPRWKRNEGRDYVFYDPHPGFVEGTSAWIWRDNWCNIFRNSIQLVVDRAARQHCANYTEMPSLLVTPYVPNVISVHRPGETYKRTIPSLAQRKTLIYSNSRCALEQHYMGVEFRLAVFQALHGLAPDIDVRCSNKGLGGVHEPFQAMLKKMEHSQFCLALPGDSPSTRRLSEIFMAGCIPVFIGPPFHAMPLSQVVDYGLTGVVFNITNPGSWMPAGQTTNLELPSEVPDKLLPTALSIIQVPDIQSIEGHLREMPKGEKFRKLARMRELRTVMTFSDQEEGALDAPGAILEMVRSAVATIPGSPLRGGYRLNSKARRRRQVFKAV